jgi:arginine decarboxylase
MAQPRNAHKSAMQALVLTGATPVFLTPQYDAHMQLYQGIDLQQLETALQQHGTAAAAVFIVSPTYTGVISDVATIARACHAHSVPLLVDEAHGSHLQFVTPVRVPATDSSSRYFGALQCGADAVVHSAHKTLGSLTQSAFLHLNHGMLTGVQQQQNYSSGSSNSCDSSNSSVKNSTNRENSNSKNSSSTSSSSINSSSVDTSSIDSYSAEGAISRALEMFTSSSPNYLLLASLDAARWQLASTQQPGIKLLQNAVQLADTLRSRIDELPGLEVLRAHSSTVSTVAVTTTATTAAAAAAAAATTIAAAVAATIAAAATITSNKQQYCTMDPLKVTVRFSHSSGYAVDDLLTQQYGVYCELATEKTVTFALGPGSTPQHIEVLLHALTQIAHSEQLRTAATSTATTATTASTAASASTAATESASSSGVLPAAVQLLTPRKAFFSPKSTVPADAAIGRISVDTVCAYPPGIPVLLPGEVITVQCLQFLRSVKAAGGSVTGSADDSLATLRVVAAAAAVPAAAAAV